MPSKNKVTVTAEPGKQALGTLPGNDGLDGLDRQWFEVDGVGDRRVRHDRGGVRVHEDGPDPLRSERAAGLRAGVVELGRLADDDRPGTEDEDGFRPAHRGLVRRRPARPHRGHPRHAATNRSNTARASSGPGAPSGWYCTLSIGFAR